MTAKIGKTQGSKAPLTAAEVREARLKVALKANMARRKSQAKQRGTEKKLPEPDFGAESDDRSGTHKE
ncbi:hypothetical protein [Pseudotabrizicola sp.]|uniref:hypothetical protein n=1 Tax=Pseudotabrizicola sp. TaxID=2939647 RepID=UPI002725140C|nr:hypothetical protein [Pseudotabrizicola sp.]MDO8882673.1 hypothetical protein [Pseudotabrizicola sp.]